MTNYPSISVIMPVYNAEKYLKEAIESILGQTFTDFELIIIDDASTDASLAVMQSYKDERIRIIQNTNNLGNYPSRNIGLDNARGKYIAVMDADDTARPQRLQVQYHYMETHPDVSACGSQFHINSAAMNKPLDYTDIRSALLQHNCFLHPSLFIRTEAMKAINGYDSRYKYSSDYDLACRLAMKGKIVNLPDFLMEYRWHKEQISQQHADAQKQYGRTIRAYYRREEQKRMPPISVVIPLRIESAEREANLHCVLQYLLQSPFVHIDLLEADREQHFHFAPHERIHYRFIYDEESVFYRTHYLNLLLKEAAHPIVGVWDADVLIPETQVMSAVWHIQEGYTLYFPYNGDFRFIGKERSKAIRQDINLLLPQDGQRFMGRPSVGGAFLVNRDKYLQAGGENEGFYGWGPEDAERVKRLEILELPVGRTEGALYHLHHERKPDRNIDNRSKALYNQKVLLNTCKMDKTELAYKIRHAMGIFSYLKEL